MKFHGRDARPQGRHVAPHAGAGIEILPALEKQDAVSVAPHAGAGIEISGALHWSASGGVAPHAGAGIEISRSGRPPTRPARRPPRGGGN